MPSATPEQGRLFVGSTDQRSTRRDQEKSMRQAKPLLLALALLGLALTAAGGPRESALSGRYSFSTAVTPLSHDSYRADVTIVDIASGAPITRLHILAKPGESADFDAPDGLNLGLRVKVSVLVQPEARTAKVRIELSRGFPIAVQETSVQLGDILRP
jgi:hypothetical protein